MTKSFAPIIAVLLLLESMSAFAQNRNITAQLPKTVTYLVNQAEEAFYDKNYGLAESRFIQLTEKDSSQLPYYKYHIALCRLYGRTQLTTVLPLLQELEDDLAEGFLADVYHFHLARALHEAHQFDEALEMFEMGQTFDQVTPEFEDMTERYVDMALNAKRLVANPVSYRVMNVGSQLNTSYPEYHPKPSKDESKLVFTSRRPEDQQNKGGRDETVYEDIYLAERSPLGNWYNASMISDSINTAYHDASTLLSEDGKRLTLYQSSKEGRALMLSEQMGRDWTSPKKLTGLPDQYLGGTLYLFEDEKSAIFSSDMPGGFGGKDLYLIFKKGPDSWGKPINLGSKINTAFDEDAPYLDESTNLLYFSSNAHETMGGYDIFKARREGSNRWSQPVNLGYPINSTGDDTHFKLVAQGRRGYFSSSRNSAQGGQDIYSVIFQETFDQDLLVTGKLDKPQNLSYPALHLVSASNSQEIKQINVNQRGEYMMFLERNKDYQLIMTSELASAVFDFSTPQLDTTTFNEVLPFAVQQIVLQPIAPFRDNIGYTATMINSFDLPDSLIYVKGRKYADKLNKDYFGTLSLLYDEEQSMGVSNGPARRSLRRITDPGLNYLTNLLEDRTLASSSSYLSLEKYPAKSKNIILDELPIALNMGRRLDHGSWWVDQLAPMQSAMIVRFVGNYAQSLGIKTEEEKIGAFLANSAMEETGLLLPDGSTAQSIGDAGLSAYTARLMHSVLSGQLAATDSSLLRKWVNVDNLGLDSIRLKEVLSTPIERLDILDINKCIQIHAEYINQKLLREDRRLKANAGADQRMIDEIERQIAFITLLELDEQNKRDLYVEKLRGIIEGKMVALVDDALQAMAPWEVYKLDPNGFMNIVNKERSGIINELLSKPIAKWAGMDTTQITSLWLLQEQRVLNNLPNYQLAQLKVNIPSNLPPAILAKVNAAGAPAQFNIIQQLTGAGTNRQRTIGSSTYALLDTNTYYHLQIRPQGQEHQMLSFKSIDDAFTGRQLPFSWILSETTPLAVSDVHVGVKQKVAYLPKMISNDVKSPETATLFSTYFQVLTAKINALSDSLNKLNTLDQLATSVSAPIEEALTQHWTALSDLYEHEVRRSKMAVPDTIAKYSRASTTIYPLAQLPQMAKVPTADGDYNFLPDHYARDTTNTLDELLASATGLLRPIVEDTAGEFPKTLWSAYLVDVVTGMTQNDFYLDSLAEITYRHARAACEVDDSTGIELSEFDQLKSFVKQRLDREITRQNELISIREEMELEYLEMLRAELVTLSLDQALSFDQRALEEFFMAHEWDQKSTAAYNLDSLQYLDLLGQIKNAWSEQDTLAWKGAILQTNYRLSDSMSFLAISLKAPEIDVALSLTENGNHLPIRKAGEDYWLAHVNVFSELELSITSPTSPPRFVTLPSLDEIKSEGPGLIWMQIVLEDLGKKGQLGELVHVNYSVVDELGEDEQLYFEGLVGQLAKSYSSPTFINELKHGQHQELNQEEQQLMSRLGKPVWETLPAQRNSLQAMALEDQVYLNIESVIPVQMDKQLVLQSRTLELDTLPMTRTLLELANELNTLFELNSDDFKQELAAAGLEFRYKELKRMNSELHTLYQENPDLMVEVFAELIAQVGTDTNNAKASDYAYFVSHKDALNKIIADVAKASANTAKALESQKSFVSTLLDSMWMVQSANMSLGDITSMSKEAWLAQSMLWLKHQDGGRLDAVNENQLLIWLKNEYGERYIIDRSAMLEHRGSMLWEQAQQTSSKMIMIDSRLKDVWQGDELADQDMEMQIIDSDGAVWPYLMQPDKNGNFLMMLAPDKDFKLKVILSNDVTFEVPIHVPDSFAFRSLPLLRHELSLAPIQVADSVIAMEWNSKFEGQDNPEMARDVHIHMQDWASNPDNFRTLPTLDRSAPLNRGDSARMFFNQFQGFVNLSADIAPEKPQSTQQKATNSRDYQEITVALSNLIPVEPSNNQELADILEDLKSINYEQLAELSNKIETTENWTPGKLQTLKKEIDAFDYKNLNHLIIALEEIEEYSNPALKALAEELKTFNYQNLTRVLHQLETMETSDRTEMEYAIQSGQNFEFIELAYILESISKFEVVEPDIASDLLINALSEMLSTNLNMLDDSGATAVVQAYLTQAIDTATGDEKSLLTKIQSGLQQNGQYINIQKQVSSRSDMICESVQQAAKSDITVYTANGFDRTWKLYEKSVDPASAHDDLIAGWVRQNAANEYASTTKEVCYQSMIEAANITQQPDHMFALASINGHKLPKVDQSIDWDGRVVHWEVSPIQDRFNMKTEIGVGSYQEVNIPAGKTLVHVHTTLQPVTFLGDTVAFKAKSNRRSLRLNRISEGDRMTLNVLLSLASNENTPAIRISQLLEEMVTSSDLTYAMGVDSTWVTSYQVMAANRSRALANLSVSQVESVAPILEKVATELDAELHDYASAAQWEDLAVRLQKGDQATVIKAWEAELSERRRTDHLQHMTKGLLAVDATTWVQNYITNNTDSAASGLPIKTMLSDTLQQRVTKQYGQLTAGHKSWIEQQVNDYYLAHESSIKSQVAVSQLMAKVQVQSTQLALLPDVEVRETELPDPDPSEYLEPVRMTLLVEQDEDVWGSEQAVDEPEKAIEQDIMDAVLPTTDELATATLPKSVPAQSSPLDLKIVQSADSLILFFRFNTSELTDLSTADIKHWLKNFDPYTKYQLVGYTDTAGTTAYNEMLSLERANVAGKVFESLGVPSSNIETIGAGERHQVADNRRLKSRIRNRRVVARPIKP